MSILERLMPNVLEITDRLLEATWETIYMTLVSGIFVFILGIIIGVVLVVTRPGGISENSTVYNVIDKIVNALRSIPFVILIALVGPLTRLIAGTTIGTTAAIVPLIIGMVPFYSKQVQNALLEVDPGIIEAAQSMGASNREIIFSVYLKEGLPSLIRTTQVSIINLISLTAMAGTIGGGGLGDLAITRGYNRYQMDVTIVCTLIIMLLVILSQVIGNILVDRVEH